jgi:hypothetical protein
MYRGDHNLFQKIYPSTLQILAWVYPSSAWELFYFTAFALREKCKAGAFIFPYRRPRSGPGPKRPKGGKANK